MSVINVSAITPGVTFVASDGLVVDVSDCVVVVMVLITGVVEAVVIGSAVLVGVILSKAVPSFSKVRL